MKINKITYKLLVLVSLLPIISLAALDGLKNLLGDIKTILSLVNPLVIALAFIYFFWGMGQFILRSGDEKTRQAGEQKMIWGVIALFVILSIMGILTFIGNLIGLPTGDSGLVLPSSPLNIPPYSQLPTGGTGL